MRQRYIAYYFSLGFINKYLLYIKIPEHNIVVEEIGGVKKKKEEEILKEALSRLMEGL